MAARAIAAAAALISLAGLVLRTVLNVGANLEKGESAGAALWHLAGLFTIWGNVAVVVVAGAIALAPRSAIAGPRVRTAVAAAIIIIGVVFALLLRYLLAGEPLMPRIASYLMHDYAPIAFALAWLLAGHGRLAWRDALWALLLPGVYLAVVLVRGLAEGFAPYWFLDIQTLGLALYARNAAGLAVGFAVIGLALVAIDKTLARLAGRAASE